MKIRYFFFIFIVLIAAGSRLFAQVTVTQGAALGMTPLQLVQNVLVGQGVTISNATFNGSSAPITSNQVGSFSALNEAYDELGLSGGVIMSSGTAVGAIGPNNSGGFTGSIPAGPGDPDLTIIANTDTHDAAVLEFDFVPVSDTLRFRYVFGSEEFLEYCNQYNDAFGFFLSGPGITGTFSNNSVDIALMPESLNYVTIDNLCADPASRWVNPPGGLYFQYDGLSIILTAWHIVVPCQTYHIKLAVADAGDWAFDSGVFLEENSFTASGFTVDNTFTHPGLGQVSIEDCSDATIIFHLATPTVQNDTIHYTIGGIATNGVDYTLIPDYVIIPAGLDSTILVIHPFMDLLPEGTETVILDIPMLGCSGGTIYHDTISILDNLPLVCQTDHDTTFCEGLSVTLHAIRTGGQFPYIFDWNTGSHLTQITVTPPVGANLYTVTVTDGCTATSGDSVIVTVNPIPVITNPGIISTVCTGSATSIVLQSSVPGSTYSWTATCSNVNISGYSPGNGPSITQTLFNTGTTVDTVTYHVTATASGCLSQIKDFKVAVIPSVDAYFQPNVQSVCSGGNTAISILSHTTGTTFTWTYSLGSANLSGASNGNGNIISQSLFNSGYTTDTVTYIITPSNSGCSGGLFTVKVAVYPVQDVWAQPSSQPVCPGTPTSISLYSHVAGTIFSWTATCPSPNIGGYGPGSGNAIVQTMSNTGSTSEIVTYHVIPSANGCPANSLDVEVTVNPFPVPVIAGPGSVCAGTAGNIYSAQPGMSNYQWTISPGGTITAGGGPGNNTMTVTWNTPGSQSVSVNFNDLNGCSALVPTSYPVTVNPLPVPSLTGPAAICLNSSGNYSTDAGMTNYTWTVSAGGTITAGAGTNTITVLWNTTGANTITVNYSDANGCRAAIPTSYPVTVSTLPVPSLNGLNTICSGNSTTYTTDAGMNNYIWVVSAGGSITAGGGTTDNSVTVLWNTAGPQTVSVNYTVGIGCTAPNPTVLNVTVKPRPSVTNAANFTICSPGTTNIVLLASLPGTTFSWTASGSSANVTGFSPGSGSLIAQTLQNNGFNLETVTYSVTPSLNGCDGPVAPFVVTVNPVADVYFTPNGQNICSGTSSGITIQSHVALTTFAWTASGSSANVTGFGPGTGSLIAQTLTSTGSAPETVTYNVTPTFSGCIGTHGSVMVTVNPNPSVTYTLCNDPMTTTAAQPFNLRGGVPLGGTFAGPGVNAGFFFPSLAGTGNHTITYSYSNTWGCAAAASQVISVISPVGFPCDNPMTDIRDNKQYPTVKIGTQCWLAANLNYGNFIASSQMQRDNCLPEKYCFNDNLASCNSYGGLYQWDEMMKYNTAAAEQGFCPPGWHVPTENEWATLFSIYINNGFAGSPLKYTGYSNFNAFLSGTRFNNVEWDFSNFAVMFWSSTTHGPDKAWAHGMNTFNPSVSYYPSSRTHAFNLRCIND